MAKCNDTVYVKVDTQPNCKKREIPVLKPSNIVVAGEVVNKLKSRVGNLLMGMAGKVPMRTEGPRLKLLIIADERLEDLLDVRNGKLLGYPIEYRKIAHGRVCKLRLSLRGHSSVWFAQCESGMSVDSINDLILKAEQKYGKMQ